jgi:hypothetical protein
MIRPSLFLEVRFPSGVEQICLAIDLAMSADRSVSGLRQIHFDVLSILLHRCAEDPVPSIHPVEVTILYAVSGFVPVSAARPFPELFPDSVIDFLKGLFRHLVLVIVGPSPNDGVEGIAPAFVEICLAGLTG